MTRLLSRSCLLILLVLFCTFSAMAADSTYLYRTSLIQAAPGKYQELIDAYKMCAAHLSEGDEAPLWMRHSQGDHWDFLILWPMGSYADFYNTARIAKRKKAEASRPFQPNWSELIASQEDVFVQGPPLADLRNAFSNSKFFHVEMFQALPARHAELMTERQMENVYQRKLKRPENFIFTRDQGAAWDIFTIGCYRDLKHYSESADIPEKDQEDAAHVAGFKAANQIGPYLRQFIRSHHDTLAVAIK